MTGAGEDLRRDFDTLRGFGLHPIPVGANKMPFIKWALGAVNYVQTMPDDADREKWSDDLRTRGWAVACGNKQVKVFTLDVEAAGMPYPEITGVLERLPETCQRPSPSGGRHAVIVVTDGDPVPTGALAQITDGVNPDGTPHRVLLAEVRGVSKGDRNGAYAQVTGPGRGPLQHGFAPARMTRAEADDLLAPIRALDQPTERQLKVRANKARARTGTGKGGGTGGIITDAILSGALTWPQVLEPGWTIVSDARGRIGLLRPGSPESAESGNAVGAVLTVHSSAVDWADPGDPINAPQALAASRFDGDYHAAMSAVEEAAQAHVDGAPAPEGSPCAGWPPEVLAQVHAQATEYRRRKQAEDEAQIDEMFANADNPHDDQNTDKGGAGDGDDGDTPEPTSWLPQNLDDVLDGTYRPEVPDLMLRTDGHGLLYRSRVHSVHGESESGKSLLMQWVAAEVLRVGGRVLYLDFESDRASVVGRLLALGAPVAAIRGRFAYVHPEEPVVTDASKAAWADHLARPWDLAVVDGVTDAMNVLRFTGDKRGDVNDQATQFIRTVPKRIASATGAAVVLVDHVTKSQDGRGRFAIGAQAKLSGLTGAAYTLEVTKPLAPGQVGELVLRVGKDRPAGVRQWCSPQFRASDRTQEAARVSVDSTGDRITVTLKPPADLDPQATPFRPTTLMERVAAHLATHTEPVSMNEVTSHVTGKRSALSMAVDCLVAEGNVERSTGPRGSHLLRLVRASDPDSWADDGGRSQTPTAPTEAPDSVRDRVPSREGDAGRSRNGDATASGTQSGTSRDAVDSGTQSPPGPPDDDLGPLQQSLDDLSPVGSS